MSDDKNRKNYPQIDAFEDVREAILEQMLARAAFEGWTEMSLRGATVDAGVTQAAACAAFPSGVADVLKAWSIALDASMLAAMEAPEFASMKIREKVTFAVWVRLEVMQPYKEAARRAAATLALPLHAPLGMRLVWRTADTVWRGLGDKSTDFNFYSKRTILSGVWTSTFAHWLSDDSEGQRSTREFLDARIENVMQIEKTKAKFRDLNIDPVKPVEWLARLRYAGRS